MFDIRKIREDFPILARHIHNNPLVYFDNAASAQKPQVVIDAVTNAYSNEYANVHRGLHYLSNVSTEKFESVRSSVANFLGAEDEREIILNSGTTQGINTIAYGWAMPRFQKGDEIVLSTMEHHANIVPWHLLRERLGVVLKWVDIEENGDLDPQKVIDAIGSKTKLVAITHMSNVLGTIVDVQCISKAAQSKGVPVLIDGSQAAVHLPIDVTSIGCDFYAITGHKLYGPSGSGAIYVRRERLEEMQPFIAGGNMISEVHKEAILYNEPPFKFEAGTPGIVEAIGFGVALEYVMNIGMDAIAKHEKKLCDYAVSKFDDIDWLELQGQSTSKGAIFSFILDGAAHAHDISTILDKKGVAVRAGHHCAGPLMDHFGLTATCRASMGMYNTVDEVDILIDALELAHELFR